MGRTIISLLFLMLASCVFAQKSSHRLGLSYMLSWEQPYEFRVIYPNRPPVDVVTPKESITFIGLNYHFSRTLLDFEPKKISIGIGAPISISALFKASTSQGVSPDNYIYMSLPLQLEFNFGAGALPNNASFFGGFASMGFNYHFINTREDNYQAKKFEYKQFNPMASAGFRFRFGERLLQLSYSHTFLIEKRENLGDIQGPYPYLPLPTEIYFERGKTIRGMEVISLSAYLSKKY